MKASDEHNTTPLAAIFNEARRILEFDPGVRRLHRRARSAQYRGNFSLADVLSGGDRLAVAIREAPNRLLSENVPSPLACCRLAIWLAVDVAVRRSHGGPPPDVSAAAVELVRIAVDVARREFGRTNGVTRGAPDPTVSRREAARRRRIATVRAKAAPLLAEFPALSRRSRARLLLRRLGEPDDERGIRALVAFCTRNAIIL